MSGFVEGFNTSLIVADIYNYRTSSHGSYHLSCDHCFLGILRPSYAVDYQICCRELLSQVIFIGNNSVDFSVILCGNISQCTDIYICYSYPRTHSLKNFYSTFTYCTASAYQRLDSRSCAKSAYELSAAAIGAHHRPETHKSTRLACSFAVRRTISV